MNYKKIPQFLKENAKWCGWKYVHFPGEKKARKVPINPRTGGNASVSKPMTFADYETLIKGIEKFGLAGGGIRSSSKLIVLDMDDCVKNGVIADWVQEIIHKYPNAYVEISPSGTGIHMVLLAPEGFILDDALYYTHSDTVEFYFSRHSAEKECKAHYVTITGDVVQEGNFSVVTVMEDLQWLLDKHLKRPTPVHYEHLDEIMERESYLSDEQVIEKASNARNGEKFRKLWSGNLSDYSSHSEADLAMTGMIAFYTNGNYEQTDRLMHSWSAIRPKWDERHGAETYGDMTIRKSLSGIKDYYKPFIPPEATDDFNDLMTRLVELNPEDTGKYPWTDIGAGKLMADFYEPILTYVPERKAWFHYKDGIWQNDACGLIAGKLCMDIANLLLSYALNITDEHRRKSYIDYVKRWQSHSVRMNILKDAQVYHPTPAAAFDTDPYIFNCSNATLHINTCDYSRHISTDKLTKISSVKYDPDAYSDRWNDFIFEIMSGDEERAKFLQKILGYGLTGDTRHECMITLYGASTRNGKGTLCESVLRVLGGYGCTSRPETIALKNSTNSQAPSEDIARLAGVRFVNIAEPGKGLVLNAAQVKSMTGNDTLNARFLHENNFDFQPQFKIYINTNYLPIINDMTVFTSGRMIIVPFERHFEEMEQDKSLKHEFAKPEVQSAILNWLIEGYHLLQKEGLALPQSVKDATARYQHDSDKLILFMEDCLESGDGYEARTSDVYNRYKNWCGENGQFAESMKNFKQSLETKVTVTRKRPHDGGEKTTVVTGYRLISEFLQ